MRTQTGFFRSSPFFDVYYFADLAIDILRDPLESGVEWSDFMTELAEVQGESFPTDTALHRFLREMVARSMYDQDFRSVSTSLAELEHRLPGRFEFQRPKLRIERALSLYDLTFDAFVPEDDDDLDSLHEWYQNLVGTEAYSKLLQCIADEVFTILFANRVALFLLNDWLARKIDRSEAERPGRADPPVWARRAIFFRDRGRCCNCATDLSGLLSIHIRPNFDHVVPLVAAGPNDVTNLQLLCANCNQKKGSRRQAPTFTYEPWFLPD